MNIQKALKDIHFFRGVIPHQAYEYFNQNRSEASPHLLQILADTLARHDRTGDYYVAHIHALLLLSQFREQKTYPLVIELLSLPIGSTDRLIGDMLTVSIPQIIASVYDGNPAPLFTFLENAKYDKCVRFMAGSCLAVLIYHQTLQKEFVTVRLQEIVASGKMNDDQTFFTALANLVLEAKLEPLYDIVRSAFKAKMVDPTMISLHCFETDLSKPIENLIQKSYLHPIDAANELKNWGSYNGTHPISVKIERNAPCPCGKKSKFKNCCLAML